MGSVYGEIVVCKRVENESPGKTLDWPSGSGSAEMLSNISQVN